MDFVIGLLVSTNWKGKTYNSILVQLTKMVYYKPVKVIVHALDLAEVIINVVVRYHGLFNSIVGDWELIFPSKF